IDYENITYPEDRQFVRDAIDYSVTNHKKYEFDYRIITKNSKIKWVHETGQSIGMLENGQHVLLGYVFDINNEKIAADKLDDNNKKLKNTNFLLTEIFKKIPIGIATNRISDGKNLYVNKKCEEIYGWPRKYMKDLNTFFKNIYPDDDYRNKIKNRILNDIASSDEKRMKWDDIKITRKNGEIAYVDALNIPIYEQDLMVSTVVDVTDTHKQIEKITGLFNQTINAMSAILEIRDPYTSNHQLRVAKIAKTIAETMNLSSDKIDLIYYSSILHDIGKIYLPASILSKPGKLSEIEMQMVRTHPEQSFNIIQHIDFPWPIKEVIIQHHERLDGSGYPNGLKENEILTEAKILAVADVLEAITSNRPYRPSLGVEAAINELKENKGRLYDKDISEICISLVKSNKIEFEYPDI
ncbi:MAG: HD domain-containing protein, partial [Actinomycetota bacterium]|nr:HD domain-containing protein [Actinomycetota bacterium]